MGWKAGYITVDEGHTIVPGEWRDDYRWNGWLCPRMKRDAVERVFRVIAQDTEDWLFAVDGDTFYLLQHVYADDSQYELEIFEPDEEGWYSPGFMGWCWEEAPALPRTEFVTFFAECPDCGGHRYLTGRDVNRYGEGMALFTCDAGHEPLADLDIQVEWDEDWTTMPDDSGRWALTVRQYHDLPSQDVLDAFGVDTRFTRHHIVTWQELVDVYGEDRVWHAAWRFL